MKIEEGKYYRAADGQKCGPASEAKREPTGRFYWELRGRSGKVWCYDADGQLCGFPDDPQRLVAEWVDEPAHEVAEEHKPTDPIPRSALGSFSQVMDAVLMAAVDAEKAPRTTAEPMTKAKLLDLAGAAVADRGLNYGKPEDNFQRIATLWNAHLENRGLRSDWALTPADVAQMMILLKIARLEHQPKHQDSVVDIAGYAACLGEIVG